MPADTIECLLRELSSSLQEFVAAGGPLQEYTVATLPTGAIGQRAYVTDALGPTYGAVIVGGGTVVTPVFHDGTNWTAR